VPFLQSDATLWKKVIDINLYGPIHMHFAVLPGMVERGSGAVINVSSDAGRVGSSGEAVYSAAKGGIISFTKTLSRELTRAGVRLNTVCPGPTDTPLFAQVAEGDAGRKIVDDYGARSQCAGSDSPTTIPASSRSWRVTMPPTSPGRPSAFRAA
jgi:2-hydroxycyclohexanecarboxyl-CoA dehydrogenase